jgi:transcription termination factor Rho
MTAEQQLERSVLEGKERDELSAIAQAMSLKTTSRTKKSDIIDQILDATGVTSGEVNGGSGGESGNGATDSSEGNGAKPRRTRSSSAATAAAPGAAPTTTEITSGGTPSDAAPAETPAEAAMGTAAPSGPDASEAAVAGDSGPAVFVEPPELADGADVEPRQNGNGNGPGHGGVGQANRNRNQNQSNQNRNQGDGEVGNRRSRRRRGRDRGQGGELQGGGPEQPYSGEMVEVRGLLDLRDEGYGFLRCDGYLASSKDVYVSISQARKFALRRGDYVEGACRPASNNEKYPALLRIDKISGLDPDEARNRPRFEDLTPLFPDSRLNLEMPGDKDNLTARIVDLISPIGKGQRGMIVSPPKAGKTTVMKQIAHSIEANNPDVHLMVLLVDERPEEVTDMRRSVRGEVVASTFDRPSDEHTQVAELTIERAKRLVEQGKDVVIILDGITRLARAYNLAAPATGRIMSGGVDSGALYPPKKFFGAARNVEEGGSLTILASALVETGSKMDEVIFEEFKGTGNMELRLDRRLSERRLYPAIDVNASSTRHEELLFERGQLQQVWKLRRVLNALSSEGKEAAGLELLMDKIRTTSSNDEFLAEIAKGPGA